MLPILETAAPDAAGPTRLLVCAATWMELRAWWPRDEDRARLDEGQLAYSPACSFFVTGVGIPASLARTLGVLRQVRPARILSIGIAGAYPNSGLNIGDIAVGTSEVYGDIGFELPPGASADKFAVKHAGRTTNKAGIDGAGMDGAGMDGAGANATRSGAEAGFQPIHTSPFAGTLYAEPLPLLADVPLFAAPAAYAVGQGRGCTVNLCTGTEHTGEMRERAFEVVFESMEGAAIAQAGQLAGVPVSEIRSISNIAATRDMQPDNIRLAIANLRDYLQRTAQQNFLS